MLKVRSTFLVIGLSLAAAVSLSAQTGAPADPTSQSSAASQQAPAAASTPMPLPTPTMTAPLSMAAPPKTFSAGPLGTLDVGGILSGVYLAQTNAVFPNKPEHYDLSNGQVFLQKTTGWWQFYLQGGAYNLPDLGLPFVKTTATLPALYGPLPVAYLKFVKGNFNIEVGELPTLIGAEYTFSFENMNIERGLLWNQENAVNRGVQISDTYKKLTLSASWNDGFYSNVWNWVTGSAAYAFNSSNTLSFVGGGNTGQTATNTFATPLFLANQSIYEVLYTYSHGNWMITPYWQYTHVPMNTKIGIPSSGSTDGGAVLVNYNFKHGVSLAARPEYISSGTSVAVTNPAALNLLYGPGSGAFAFTVTPTYQNSGFFLRGDLSIVTAQKTTAGAAFGQFGNNTSQFRGVIEGGFIF